MVVLACGIKSTLGGSLLALFRDDACGMWHVSERDFDHSLVSETHLDAPTAVNAGGKALFANIMLGTFTEGFTPRLAPEHQAVYHALYENRQLPLPDLAMLDDQLCR